MIFVNVLYVVGGSQDALEIALLNASEMQQDGTAQYLQASQQQPLTVLYNNVVSVG